MARVNPGGSAREGLSSTPSRLMGEAALQASKIGAILINSGGYLAEAGANPALGTIIGMAGEEGHNNAVAGAKSMYYVPALPHVLFEMTMAQASNLQTAAGVGGRATVVTDRFEDWGITKDADGRWYVDADKAAANLRVRVIDFVDPIGTTEGRVLVAFLNTATIYS